MKTRLYNQTNALNQLILMAAHVPQTHWTTPQKVRLKSQVELVNTENL